MSALMTNDPEGSKRFYGEVFGWGIEAFAMGEDEMVMWLVDGYVGGEPKQPVRRDVVATMLPSAGNGDGLSLTGASTSGSRTSTRPRRRSSSSAARC